METMHEAIEAAERSEKSGRIGMLILVGLVSLFMGWGLTRLWYYPTMVSLNKQVRAKEFVLTHQDDPYFESFFQSSDGTVYSTDDNGKIWRIEGNTASPIFEKRHHDASHEESPFARDPSPR